MPAALTGTYVTSKQMADGTFRLTFDMGNHSMSEIGALCLVPGSPVVVAAMTPVAALKQAQQEAAKPTECYGHYYTALYKSGWFNAPAVRAKFGADEPAIKSTLYDLFDVTSLRQIEPALFAAQMHAHGLLHTLPAMFKGYLG